MADTKHLVTSSEFNKSTKENFDARMKESSENPQN